MRDRDIKTGDLIKHKVKKITEYGIVVRTRPGLTSTSYCQPTIMWEDGRITTNLSSVGMKIVNKKS